MIIHIHADISYKNAAPVLKLWDSGVSITKTCSCSLLQLSQYISQY